VLLEKIVAFAHFSAGRRRARAPRTGAVPASVTASDADTGRAPPPPLPRAAARRRRTRRRLDRHRAGAATAAGADAHIAWQAIWALSAVPVQTVPFVKARLQPAAAVKVDARQIARWIADLDSGQFTVRERACRELEKLRDQAAAPVRHAFTKPASLEAKRRLENVIERLVDHDPPPEQLQALRALQVLETIGDDEARQVLKKLASGATEAILTQEAQATLERVEKRVAKK
jgi:hypothetical protein